jgi:hypothetical protein
MTEKSSNDTPHANLEVSHLLKKYSRDLVSRPIGEIEVRPGEQCRMSLGVFNIQNPPEGFITHLMSKNQNDSIIMQIVSTKPNDRIHKLILHIANYGNNTASVEVRQIQK